MLVSLYMGIYLLAQRDVAHGWLDRDFQPIDITIVLNISSGSRVRVAPTSPSKSRGGSRDTLQTPPRTTAGPGDRW